MLGVLHRDIPRGCHHCAPSGVPGSDSSESPPSSRSNSSTCERRCASSAAEGKYARAESPSVDAVGDSESCRSRSSAVRRNPGAAAAADGSPGNDPGSPGAGVGTVRWVSGRRLPGLPAMPAAAGTAAPTAPAPRPRPDPMRGEEVVLVQGGAEWYEGRPVGEPEDV